MSLYIAAALCLERVLSGVLTSTVYWARLCFCLEAALALQEWRHAVYPAWLPRHGSSSEHVFAHLTNAPAVATH